MFFMLLIMLWYVEDSYMLWQMSLAFLGMFFCWYAVLWVLMKTSCLDLCRHTFHTLGMFRGHWSTVTAGGSAQYPPLNASSPW